MLPALFGESSMPSCTQQEIIPPVPAVLQPLLDYLGSNTDWRLVSKGRVYVLLRIDGLVIDMPPRVAALLQTAAARAGSENWEGLLGAPASENHDLDEVADLLAMVGQLPPPEKRGRVRADHYSGHAPVGFVLMLSQTCNLACRYCYGRGGTYSSDALGSTAALMSEGVALRAVDLLVGEAKPGSRRRIVFFGGEPFLNRHVMRCVIERCRHLQERRGITFKFSVTTNGTVLTQSDVEMIRDNGIAVMVSLDGTSAINDVHRLAVDGCGTSEAIGRGLHLLRTEGVPFQVRSTVTREFIQSSSLEPSVHEFLTLGATEAAFCLVSGAGFGDHAFHLSPDDITTWCREIDSYWETGWANRDRARLRLFDPYGPSIAALYAGEISKQQLCGVCGDMVAVGTTGYLYPCHRFCGLDGFRIGSVWEGKNDDQAETFLSAALAATETSCNGCWYSNLCGVPCIFTRARSDCTFSSEPLVDCTLRKHLMVGAAVRLALASRPSTSEVADGERGALTQGLADLGCA